MSTSELFSINRLGPHTSLSRSAEITLPERTDSQGTDGRGDPAMTARLSYVLITPARNEEAFIEKTIDSMIHQTILPVKWVIVDDGSTDKTREIVSRYLGQHPWIELVQMPQRRDRSFAAKVVAFNAGYEKVKGIDYEVVGNLDADLSFDADYFQFILSKFSED